MGDLLKVAVSGILASGKILVAATMNAEDMIEAWNSLFPPGTVLTSLDQAFVTGQKGDGSDDGFGNDWKNLRTPNMYLSGTVIPSWTAQRPGRLNARSVHATPKLQQRVTLPK
jgi:hypothetical protein